MKKIVLVSTAAAVMAVGCMNKTDESMQKRVEALEERIKKLEERPAAPTRQAPQEQETAYNIPVGQSHVMGDKNAPVTVTVFSDYQCPFCSRTDPFLQDLTKDADLKGKVKVVFKHFPLSFHPNAKPASKAALAAGEQGSDKFWKMSTKLYENQQALTPENFDKWAKEIGLNVAKFKADLKNNDAKYEEMIKQDMELGIKEAKVRGTPSIYVAGWEFRGERSVDGVKKFMKEKNLGN